MADMKSLHLSKEFDERNLKIWKLFNGGLQYALNVSISDKEVHEDAFLLFSDPSEINEKAKDAEKRFEEILVSTMEENKLPQYLFALLEEQKAEAHSILKAFDDIISHLNDSLNNKDKAYREKHEAQNMQHELIRKRIENLISELNRVGKEEICAIRNAIVNHSKGVSDELWESHASFLNITEADKPFDSYLWKKPSEMLTSQGLEEAFLIDQKETFKLRRKLLSEVCKLRNELEEEKLDYNLKRQVFEQETFYLKEKYNRSVPVLAKIKRKCIILRDKRDKLYLELKHYDNQIEREIKIKERQSLEMLKNFKTKDRYALQYSSKCNKVFADRKEEAVLLLKEILNDEQSIYENILELPWKEPSLNNILEVFSMSQDTYWCQILEYGPGDVFLNRMLLLINQYWKELRLCSQLLKKRRDIILQSKQLDLSLQNYYKFENSS